MADFYELPVDAQVERLGALAREAVKAWGLEHARVESIKYRENAVFSVTGPSGDRAVLRVHRPGYRSDAELRSEFAWMRALAEAEIETPRCVPTREGELFALVGTPGVPEERWCDLLAWVEGQPIGSIEEGVADEGESICRTYRMLGELAARIHAFGERWSPPSDFARPAWDSEGLVGENPVFGRFWEMDVLSAGQRELIVRARDEVRQRLEAFGRAPDRYGLLHGDLLPENCLADSETIHLIDFDDSGYGWYLFELATSLFFLLPRPDYDAIWRAMLEGYRSVRALEDEHCEMMPTMLVARGLSYLGWPASRREIGLYELLAPAFAVQASEMAERYLAGEL